MTKLYQRLVRANTELQKSKEAASSDESVNELREWQISKLPEFEYDNNQYTRIGAVTKLPPTERKYRQNVYRQQQLVLEVSEWHNAMLPNFLERHQERGERIKRLVRNISNEYSELAAATVQHLRKEKSSLDTFSSDMFMLDKYDRQKDEARHEYLHRAAYMNFATGMSSYWIVYGLELDQLPIARVLRRRYESIKTWVCASAYRGADPDLSCYILSTE
ncbi:hypothetical protein CPB86DRAFT_785347 [Serendipita vermifera]|nr:hypothetical protein CPB86DRAFT_785347 [Serendipita vermifera]